MNSLIPPRILIVDDHPNAAFILAQVLKSLNPPVEIVTAHSGEDALALVGNQVIDVVITDFVMSGMNGLDLIEKLHERDCRLPILTILITAYDTLGLALAARQLQIDHFLSKPVEPSRIRALVSEALNRSSSITPLQNQEVRANQDFKVLVADDRPDNVRLLASRLSNEGYTFVTATDGEEAIEKIWSEMPDLVLLDINMPKKSGYEVLQAIRSNPLTEHIQVIIVTAAKTSSHNIWTGLNLGADDYIIKPFDWRELAARIRTKLRVKQAEDVLRRRNRELTLLPELAQDLSARLDLIELTQIVLERTVLALEATNGHLAVFYPNGRIFQRVFAQGKLFPLEEDHQKKLLAQGLISHVAATRQGAIVTDTETDDRWLRGENSKTRSSIAVPLLGRHNVIGVLTLTHQQTKHFRPEHLTLLQAIASQAAIAVENAQLYASLEQEQKRLSAVLNAAADAILVIDAAGHLQLLNPAAHQLFHQDPLQPNQPLPTGIGYDELSYLLRQAQGSNRLETGEITWSNHRTYNAQITPTAEGGHVAVLHDVTHFKQLQQVKDEFIATASHDLKNPLASMMMSCDLLGKLGPLTERQTAVVSRMERTASQMNQLVHDLLELAKTNLDSSLDLDLLDLHLLLQRIVDELLPLAEAKKQTVQWNLWPDTLLLYGEKGRMQQVLRNLIGNAIKYTPENGRIILTTRFQDQCIQLNIEDTGIGIPAADLPFIFDSFYRVKRLETSHIEGSGLGLAIVKTIVEQHQGMIHVTSSLGQGSCFSLSFPSAASVLSKTQFVPETAVSL